MANTAGLSVGLVSNILKSSTALDETHLEDSLQRVGKKCGDLRGEVYQLLSNSYEEFLPYMESTITLDEQLKDLVLEFKRLGGRVENDLRGRILQSSDKKKEMEGQVAEMACKIEFVERLMSVHQNIEMLRQKMEGEDYISASTLMTKVSSQLKRLGKDGCDAKVYLSLKTEANVLNSNLKLQLQEEWAKLIHWEPTIPIGDPDSKTALKYQLAIPDSKSDNYKQFVAISHAMRSLFSLSERMERVNRLGTRLLQAFIKQLPVDHSIKLSITSSVGSNVISLLKEERNSSSLVHGILADLSQLFATVRGCIPEEDQQQFMKQLGETIEPEITPLLIKHLLSKEVTKKCETSRLASVQKAVAEYEDTLKMNGLVDDSYSPLSDYIKDVDKHVAAQSAQKLLAQARDILKSQLYNTVSVGPPNTLLALEKLGLSQQSPEGDALTEPHSSASEISGLTFAFPSCLISESTRDFVDLVYNTLKGSSSSSSAASVQLYYTARDMVDLFMAIVVGYHKPTQLDVPRNAAVLHNNCMYVAHHLITLGHQFHAKIPTKGCTFIDFVPRLRELAEEIFTAEFEKQARCIKGFFSEFDSLEDVSNTDQQEVVYRSIRQAMLQLRNLCKAYSDVLPVQYYYKCATGLFGIIVAELIDKTLVMVDIAASDASEIYDIFTLEVISKSANVLSLPAEESESLLSTLCTNWERFKELAFVLNANQPDIVERWNGREGSLAKQFTAAEVKHLIKALFKNTDRRANTLAKIS